MRLFGNKLYLTFNEMLSCGFKEITLKQANARDSKCWDILDDPEDRRRLLFGYDKLKAEYKNMVHAQFGNNPYKMLAMEPIKEMVLADAKRNDSSYKWFLEYEYEVIGSGMRGLKPEVIRRYARASAWLNMLYPIVTTPDAKKGIKSKLGISLADFYLNVGELIAIEKRNTENRLYTGAEVLPLDFPASYQRLIDRVKLYGETGNAGIIAPEYGNKYASKLGKMAVDIAPNDGVTSGDIAPNLDEKGVEIAPKLQNKGWGFALDLYEEQMAVIRSLLARHNNFDAEQVTKMVNTVFVQKGWQTLTRSRVWQIYNENRHVLMVGRLGVREFRNTIAKQIKRSAPVFPFQYWTLDGWTVELLFQEKEGGKTVYKRLVAVFALDAMNKYIVGYAVGETESADLIKKAIKNGMQHVEDLLGAPFRPWQLQSDHFATKVLQPFYTAVAHMYVPAQVGNAKSKIIEPFFAYLNDTYCQFYDNWTGHNVTASKKNQVNREWLDKQKKNVPDRAGLMAQIHGIVRAERAKKVETFVQRFDDMPASEKVTLSREEWLMLFGTTAGKTVRATGEGLVKVINGVKYVWDTFDPAFKALSHKDWLVTVDVENLDSVLAVADEGKLRFVLEKVHVVPMAIRDQNDEDFAYREKVKAYNKDLEMRITDMYAQDHERAAKVIDTITPTNESELALKLMFTDKGQQKHGIQKAKGLIEKPVVQDIEFEDSLPEVVMGGSADRYNISTDFDEYLD